MIPFAKKILNWFFAQIARLLLENITCADFCVLEGLDDEGFLFSEGRASQLTALAEAEAEVVCGGSNWIDFWLSLLINALLICWTSKVWDCMSCSNLKICSLHAESVRGLLTLLGKSPFVSRLEPCLDKGTWKIHQMEKKLWMCTN